jgi:hypothetical protein
VLTARNHPRFSANAENLLESWFCHSLGVLKVCNAFMW